MADEKAKAAERAASAKDQAARQAERDRWTAAVKRDQERQAAKKGK
jgi:hypothetical protein